MKRLLILALIACVPGFGLQLCCQVEPDEWATEFADELTEQELERLEEMTHAEVRPIAVNDATENQLLEIPMLDETMACAILAFRDSVGDFLSVYELLSVPGMEKSLLIAIAPWLTFAPGSTRAVVQTLSMRMAVKGSWPDGDSSQSKAETTGSPHKVVIRYKAEFDRWSAGIKAEKDAGEPFGGTWNRAGFDFYSAYIGYKGKGLLRQLIIGDYRVAMAHGLLCNQAFSAGNDASMLYHPHDLRIIKTHGSMDEYYYFRGGAVRVQYKKLRIHMFGSYKPVDGNITICDSTGKTLEVSSIQKTGIHSTLAELEDRRAFREKVAGGVIQYQHKQFTIGINTMVTVYSAAIEPASTFANRDRFRGSRIAGTSLNLAWYHHWFGFSGEAAVANLKQALNHVMVFKINDNTTLWVSSRFYAPGYFTPYGASIGRGTSPTGEKGFNVVAAYTPKYGTVFRVKSDVYHIISTAKSPVGGRHGRTLYAEVMQGGGETTALFRISGETQSETAPMTPSSERLVASPGFSTLNVRGELTWMVKDALKIQCRFDLRGKSNLEKARGWQMVTGLDYRLRSQGWRFVFRHVLYHIDHYDLRIYSREAEAPGAYSMTMLYGRGQRTSLMVHYKMNRKIQVWLKAGYTSVLKPGGAQTLTGSWDFSAQLNLSI